MIVALAAVLIGLCALGVSLVQVRIMRQEQHAAVWPRLMLAQTYAQGSRVGIVVANPGIGPAVIRSVSATVDGVPRTSWTAVLDALVGEDRAWSLRSAHIQGRVVPAGESFLTVEVADSTVADRVQQQLDRLALDVCYCSVYERCWITRLRDEGAAPREVSTCPAPQGDPFRG